jgi:hypothetical protein
VKLLNAELLSNNAGKIPKAFYPILDRRRHGQVRHRSERAPSKPRISSESVYVVPSILVGKWRSAELTARSRVDVRIGRPRGMTTKIVSPAAVRTWSRL